jgi:glucosyl-dolichyl phosphate glucuronosyltransferase
MNFMDITVAICTWNRAAMLDQTLDAIHRLKIPEGISWELVIVNNNCSDNTDEIISKHSGVLPIIRVFEPKQGLSNARNAAVSASKGEYILWTDDDVLVDQDWISAYVAAFREHPGAAMFGGPITPWFEGSAPAWIKESWPIIAAAYAERDFGVEPFALKQDRLPYGANFALYATEQKKHLYDPHLGLVCETILLGEETKVMQDILKDGGLGWWVPGAGVKHWIPRSRQNLAYLRSYFIGCGRTRSRSSSLASLEWYRKPRWLWREALQNECLYLISRCFCRPNIWMVYFRKSSICRGMIFT